MEELISNGAQVDIKNEYAFTPLHTASLYGHLDCVKLLLSKGALMSVKNDRMDTPFHYACIHGHVEVVEFLISCGSFTNIKNEEGNTRVATLEILLVTLLRLLLRDRDMIQF